MAANIPDGGTGNQSSKFIPLLVWNRLEAIPRKKEFDEALRAEVHDPLWMLARQWQFGEFVHDDAGSPVFSKIAVESTKITRYQPAGGTARDYVESLPLEAEVEREAAHIGITEKAKIGKQWLKMLDKRGLVLDPPPTTAYTANLYKSDFLTGYAFSLPNVPTAQSDEKTEILTHGKLYSDAASTMLLNSMVGRQIDGWEIYTALHAAYDRIAGTWSTWPFSFVHSDHEPFVKEVAIEFLFWVEGVYGPSVSNQAWVKEQQEYHFECSLPNHNGNPDPHTILKADNYHQGHLDWFAFDISETANATLTSATDADNTVKTEKVITLLPSQGQFGGMPSTRWWEFENGAVNFGKLDATVADSPKWLLAQFALVYQDDWFVVPYKIPVGTITEVKGIVVTDTFGIKTYVLPVGVYDYVDNEFVREKDEDWNRWSMYNLSVNGNRPTQKSDPRLFVAPAATEVINGEPLEKIVFVRDEMSNNVWAIESTVLDYAGRPTDGRIKGQDYVEYLKNLRPFTAPSNPNQAELSYQLASQVPEHWIPFVPVHTSSANRSIKLRRASLLRALPEYDLARVRPQTQLLRDGINGQDNQTHPLNIFEEEIPRAGAIVKKQYNRTRWYNGKTALWVGRQKTTGKGEGYSGLAFDNILTRS